MSKICNCLIYLLLCPGFIFCMEFEKEFWNPISFNADIGVYEEFVGEEFLEVIKELVQFACSFEEFFNSMIQDKETKNIGCLDKLCLDKRVLSWGLFKKVQAVSNELIDLCLDLAKLEEYDSIISVSFEIKRSFSKLFDIQIRNVISTPVKPKDFKLSRLYLLTSLSELKSFIKRVSLKIIVDKKAPEYLIILNKMLDVCEMFENGFAI